MVPITQIRPCLPISPKKLCPVHFRCPWSDLGPLVKEKQLRILLIFVNTLERFVSCLTNFVSLQRMQLNLKIQSDDVEAFDFI